MTAVVNQASRLKNFSAFLGGNVERDARKVFTEQIRSRSLKADVTRLESFLAGGGLKRPQGNRFVLSIMPLIASRRFHPQSPLSCANCHSKHDLDVSLRLPPFHVTLKHEQSEFNFRNKKRRWRHKSILFDNFIQ